MKKSTQEVIQVILVIFVVAIYLQLHDLSKITHLKRKFQHKIVAFKNI